MVPSLTMKLLVIVKLKPLVWISPPLMVKFRIVTFPDKDGYLLRLAGTITSSPVAGTPLGAQFEAVDHAELVAPVHVLVTAKADEALIKATAKSAKSLFDCFIVILCIYLNVLT